MRVVIIGLDAFEPRRFERLYEEGRLPNLARYVDVNAYARFAVSNPPQSEVSWTSIATGLNPGGHGMFDFVHRNPANYALNVSLLPTKSGIEVTVRPLLDREGHGRTTRYRRTDAEPPDAPLRNAAD